MSTLSAIALGAAIGFALWSTAPTLERWADTLLDTPPGRALTAAWEFIRFDLPDAIRRR